MPWLVASYLQSLLSPTHGFLSVSLWLHRLYSYEDTRHIGLGAHLTPVWPHFNLTNHTFKNFLSKKDHVLRFWELGPHLSFFLVGVGGGQCTSHNSALDIMGWTWHFTSVVFLLKKHNSILTMKKKSDKSQLRNNLQNICPILLKTIKVIKKNKKSLRNCQPRAA